MDDLAEGLYKGLRVVALEGIPANADAGATCLDGVLYDL